MLQKLSSKLLIFIERDLPSSTFWSRKLQNLLRFVYFVRKGLSEKHCLQRAAGMAYTSLLAMVPTLVVFFSTFSIRFFPEDIKTKFELFLLNNLIPETSQRLSEQISNYLQVFKLSATTIGLIGSIFLIISVFALMNTIENTFNSIMEVPKKRNLLHKLSAYTTIIIWSSLLGGLSFYFAKEASFLDQFPFLQSIQHFFRNILMVTVFYIAYKMIPNRHIDNKSAIIGSLWGAILWEAARAGFSTFASKMVTLDKIYGALGVIPLFLIWLYLAWIVVLIGIEIVYVSQFHRSLSLSLKPMTSADSVALDVLRLVGKTYSKGKKLLSIKRIASQLGTKEEELLVVLEPLFKKEWLSLTESRALALTTNPSHISIWELVALFQPTLSYKENTSLLYKPLQIKLTPDDSIKTLDDWINKN